MMKQLFSLCFLLILAGCTESSFEGNHSIVGNEEFYATLEGTDSRTYVDEQIRMRWNAEDEITIFKKNTYNRTFMFTGSTGANAGGFRQTSTDDDFWFGYDVDYNYAVYPHSAENALDETDLYLTVDMPAEQTYAENSFGLNANTMVAVSESNQLIFKNVGGYLRIRLYGENVAVSSVTLTSKGNEAIAGKAKITPSLEGNPTCEMTGTGKSIKLICVNPVVISSDADAPTDFWIVVPPVTLASGFKVTVENNMGDTQVYEVNQSFTFERNKYYDMAREVTIKSETPYVTFTANASQTLTMSKAVETLEYSVNGGDWSELGTSTITFGGNNGNLRLRGKNLNGTASSSSDYSQIIFGNENPVTCTGDIRTLLDYENYNTSETGNAKFFRLFWNCSCLTSAPQLPATILADKCYSYMFSNCSLTEAPELPATTLTEDCYLYMFENCSSLTEAPLLPATTLAESCYYKMFSGCTNLTEAPQLPATTLAENCYSYMFYGCNRLTEAPELPATALAESCYFYMFENCSGLTETPELPATTLERSCYLGMFSGCISLTEASELPATTLSGGCYASMFKDCTNLTKAPQLPATTLEDHCYESMFYGCSSLKAVTMLATSISDTYCLENWMSGVASTGTFTKAKEMESLPTGSNGIPSGWEVVDYED